MKPLDETQRDNILMKILRIGKTGERNKNDVVMEAIKELENLENKGYDVDSYFLVLKDFIERYLLVRS
tara:strand:- start:162 stop:365 length:204 start_codon:yes stop_codon:yes gene_type:complete